MRAEREMRPSISVCMPIFNGSKYLPTAIKSLAGQSFQNFEVVIVDDGSSDDSAVVAERLLKRHGLCGSVVRTPNRGAEQARNAAFDSASADILAALDCDDSWDPTYLESMLGILEKFPEVDLAYCDMRQEADNGAVVLKSQLATWIDLSKAERHDDVYVFAPPRFFRLLLAGIVTLPSCTIFRKRLYKSAGEIPTVLSNLPNALDWYFSLRASRSASVAFLNRPLVHHPVYASSTSGNLIKLTDCNVRVIRWLLRDGGLDKAEQATARRKGATICTWACDALLRRQRQNWIAAKWAIRSLRFQINWAAVRLLALCLVPRSAVERVRRWQASIQKS